MSDHSRAEGSRGCDCARYRAERDALVQAMERVAEEIEQMLLGYEVAEDAPAMRWARELRAALGSLHAPGFQKMREVATSLTSHSNVSDVSDATTSAYDLLPDREREAIEWVHAHGGLGVLKSRIDVALAYEAIAKRLLHRLGVLGLNNECSAADRAMDLLERRGKDAERLRSIAAVVGECLWGSSDAVPDGITVDVLRGELERRIMPEGMVWPRYDTGEQARPGDEVYFERYDVAIIIDKVAPRCEGYSIFDADGIEHVFDSGLRLKRPDSKEQLERDIRSFAEDNSVIPHDVDQMERDVADLVRRGMALVGVE